MDIFRKKAVMPEPDAALSGRDAALDVANRHFVNGNPILPPFPDNMEQVVFAHFPITPGIHPLCASIRH